MQLIKPTFGRAALIWWTICWRSLLYGLVGAVLAGVVIGVAGGLVGADQSAIAEWAKMSSLFIATPACIYAAYSRLGKVCGDFRIVLVKADSLPDQAYEDQSIDLVDELEERLPARQQAA